jgi:uncharacterized membrane protein YhaH (DUF805 family)
MRDSENNDYSLINWYIGGTKRKLGRLIYNSFSENNPDSKRNALIRKLYLIVKVDLTSAESIRRAILNILCVAVIGSCLHHFASMYLVNDRFLLEMLGKLNTVCFVILFLFIVFGYIFFPAYNCFLTWYYMHISDDIKNTSLAEIIDYLRAYDLLSKYSSKFMNRDVENLVKYRKTLQNNIINNTEYISKENNLLKKVMISENYLTTAFKKYANFSGRASRAEYWGFYLVNSVVCILILTADEIIKNHSLPPFLYLCLIVFAVICGLLMIIPSIAVIVRRLHDIGLPGWYIFCYIIPIFGQLFALFVSLKSGQDRPNQYGINPSSMYYKYKNRLDRQMSGQIEYSIKRMESLFKENRIDQNEYTIIRENLIKRL